MLWSELDMALISFIPAPSEIGWLLGHLHFLDIDAYYESHHKVNNFF